MSAPVQWIQNKLKATHDITAKAVEVNEMKTESPISQAKTWLAKCVKTPLSLRLVSVTALGALFLLVVFGFPFGSTDASNPTVRTGRGFER